MSLPPGTMVADSEVLHPDVLYAGMVVGVRSCASQQFVNACESQGVEITTNPSAFITSQGGGKYEDRFRFRVAREQQCQQGRAKIGLAAFDAGTGPTAATIWRVGGDDRIRGVQERIGEAINGAGRAVGAVVQGAGQAAGAVAQGVGETGKAIATLPVVVAVLGGLAIALYYASKG